MFSKADVLVLHALTLPIDQACEFVMEEVTLEPALVMEPAMDWWARKYGGDLKAYVLTQTYRDRAPFRHARVKRRAEEARSKICIHCGKPIEFYKEHWWNGDDFMCPDGEQAHAPAEKARTQKST